MHPTIVLPSQPWWRFRIMWLVVGGPAAVVVAGFATLAIALARPDPVLPNAGHAGGDAMPAVQARNHAATPARR